MVIITVKTTHIIRPAEETPKGVMLLADLDHIISITHTPTVYFFGPPATKSLENNWFDKVKQSLSKALVLFYPLAGRVQPASTGRGRFEVNCNSEGVVFVEAESSDSAIADFGDFCPCPAMQSLVPVIDYDNRQICEIPLLFLQLTKFSCGGLSLGMASSHLIMDGTSVNQFLFEWARITRGEEDCSQNIPFLDRTLLQPPLHDDEPFSDHSLEFKFLPRLIGSCDQVVDGLEEKRKETEVAMFTLSEQQVQKLVDKANNGQASSFTRYEALCGHMWRCVSKARQLAEDQQTVFHLAVNFRNRVEPKLPKNYFGNAILYVATTTTSGMLLKEPLSYASGLIRETINKVTTEYVRSTIAYLKHEDDMSLFFYHHGHGTRGGAFVGNPNCNIVGWAGIPSGGIDFGWGKQIHAGPISIGSDGKAFLLPCRYEKGSLVLALRLQVAHMDAFRKCFYEDIYKLPSHL